MESNIQSSFIPHDAGTPIAPRRRGAAGLADIALMLGILAFAASAALAVGVFLYQQYLASQATSDLGRLKRDEAQFQPALIEELTRLDARMRAAQGILASHNAPSAFFDLLNQVTAKTVSYNSLSFTVVDAGHITLEMDGVARSVNSIAFESNLLGKSGMFNAPIFSNLDHQKDGVHFHLSTLLNPDSVNFQRLTGAAGSAAPSSVSPAPASSPAPPASPFGGTQPAR